MQQGFAQNVAGRCQKKVPVEQAVNRSVIEKCWLTLAYVVYELGP